MVPIGELLWEPQERATKFPDMKFRSIYELTTEEAYQIISRQFGHELPPLDAVENEDWGRDYVLQHFQQYSPEELAKMGLQWELEEE